MSVKDESPPRRRQCVYVGRGGGLAARCCREPRKIQKCTCEKGKGHLKRYKEDRRPSGRQCVKTCQRLLVTFSWVIALHHRHTAPILRLLDPHRPLTCGTCANKSRLVPQRDPSIIAREHLKITRREIAARRAASQTDRGRERAPVLMLLIVEEMNIPLQSD